MDGPQSKFVTSHKWMTPLSLTFTGHPVPDPHAVLVPRLVPTEGDVESATLDGPELHLVHVGQQHLLVLRHLWLRIEFEFIAHINPLTFYT